VDRYLQIRISITVGEAQRIRRLMQRRSCEQGRFDMIAEKETDLKMKRLFRPRWITIELFADVKGISVILHGLCPVPINR
jgi:dephospho-CoA kinase